MKTVEEERIAALRGLAVRWAVGLGIVLALLAAWRLFLLFCPTRDWSVLRWSLEPATAQNWNEPWIPALVAENGLENGGVVGRLVGRILYDRTLAPATSVSGSAGPQPYSAVHPSTAWLGTHGLAWKTDPPANGAVLVHVQVQALLATRVRVGSCVKTQAETGLVDRDYLVVQTPRGWRVEHVFSYGAATGGSSATQGVGAGTAAAALEGCG